MKNLSELLTEIAKLDEKATKGPWELEKCSTPNCWCGVVGCEKRENGVDWVVPNGSVLVEDCAFIAFARTALPLLAKVVVEQQSFLPCTCADDTRTYPLDCPGCVCKTNLDALVAEAFGEGE